MFSASDGYERFMGRWSRELAPMLVEFAGTAPGDAVLDVGCGTGALSVAAAAVSGVRVIGVDPSDDFVRFATSHVRTGRIRFEVGQASALSFPDGQFDRTLSLLVLNFVPEPGAAVREMIRVTRSGGVIAAAVWDYASGMQMLREFWHAAVELDPAAAPRDERHMPLCGDGELAELLKLHRLTNVEQRELSIEMRFASFDDYWQPFLAGQGPAGAYTISLPDAARNTLEGNLRQRLSSSGAFTLNARARAVRGVVT